MNSKLNQRPVRKILAVSISAIGLTIAAPAMAQSSGADDEVKRLIRPDSEVSVGVLDVSKSSYKFGDYNGMHKSGGHLIGDVRISTRGEGNANYLDIVGSNLGLDSRNLRIQGGEQGNYGLSFEYDQIHKLWTDSYQTPYANPGSDRLALPAGWVAGATTATMTSLAGSMQSFNIETQRKSIALGLTKLLPGDWDVAVDFKHETKQGNRLLGAVVGNSGGNPRAAVLPEPVDYVTRQFSVIARYTTDNLQFQGAYSGSLFDNKKQSLQFQNAFSTIGGWAAGTGFPAFGQIGQPPDNQAHQLSASLGYQFSKATRLAGSLSYSRMTQNDSFLPYTGNPVLTITNAMPRSSLEGKVNNTHLDLKLTSKLTKDWNLLAAYRYDDRSNKTPQSLYDYIGADSTNQNVAAISNRWRTNLPGSSTKHLVEVEADYRLSAHTKLKFGWEYEWAKKTFEAINKEWEHTLKGEVHHHFSDTVSGGLSYAWSDRRTSNYDYAGPFIASFAPAYVASQGAPSLQWDNNPYQRKFFMAPRTRDKLHAFINLEPMDKVDLRLGVDYKDDNYSKSYYGLQDSRGYGVNADVNYVASDALTANLHAAVDRYTTFQRSNSLAAACGGGKANPTAPGCDWTGQMADHNYLIGLGLRYRPGEKYEFGGDYTYSKSIGKTDMWAAVTKILPLPENTNTLNRLDLFGRYALDKNISLNVKYIYERFQATDWALEGLTPASMANLIGTNQTAPNYSVHAVGVSVNYQFQ
ncbi:MAG: MtrB/PioB family decaheme-associated outer membrane protein [Sulfuritalea sp.]|nr:MtrB/PioB family decaheme-associated outer membrane protein [Sulfuritalea sp.]